MQAQLHKKYNLQSYRKRSRGKDQSQGTSSQVPPTPTDKGKGSLDQITQKNKDFIDSNHHKPEVLIEE